MAYTVPLALPFCYRFGPRVVRRTCALAFVATALAMCAFALRAPFDDMHMKRLFVMHSENVRRLSGYIIADDAGTDFILRVDYDE